MIPTKYIEAYFKLLTKEMQLTHAIEGVISGEQSNEYFSTMYSYIEHRPDDFVDLEKSGVQLHELELAERVPQFLLMLLEAARIWDVPQEILFVPAARVNGKWRQFIHKDVVRIVRMIYDDNPDAAFATLRKYTSLHKYHAVTRWVETKDGKQFLDQYQKSTGTNKKDIFKKRLQLFGPEFASAQARLLSQDVWVLKDIIQGYNERAK